MSDDTPPDADTETVRFDESTEVSLSTYEDVSKFDLDTLNKLGILETTTETRNGETVVTECRLHPGYLALMVTEFNTVEKSLGKRFTPTGWRAESRTRL